MIKSKIGENDGKIWQILNNGIDITLKKLQKLSGATAQEFYMAIGWLSRENKIYIFDIDEEIYVSLVE